MPRLVLRSGPDGVDRVDGAGGAVVVVPAGDVAVQVHVVFRALEVDEVASTGVAADPAVHRHGFASFGNGANSETFCSGDGCTTRRPRFLATRLPVVAASPLDVAVASLFLLQPARPYEPLRSSAPRPNFPVDR